MEEGPQACYFDLDEDDLSGLQEHMVLRLLSDCHKSDSMIGIGVDVVAKSKHQSVVTLFLAENIDVVLASALEVGKMK